MTFRRLPPASEYPFLALTNPFGLRIRLYPDGRLFDVRHGETLINGYLPTPAEHAMSRLYLRDREGEAAFALLGPALTGQMTGGVTPSFKGTSDRSALWSFSADGLEAEVLLLLHEREPAWLWRVTMRNTGDEARRVDLLYGQDLGLAGEGGVRSNEAYCAQYIDHHPVADEGFGPVILSRQNQAQGGAFPWVAQGCIQGAVGWCTDGYQFFGADHRVTGRPAALGMDRLPNSNLQYEFAYPALQSPELHLAPGESTTVEFFAAFQPDHPAASGPEDLDSLRLLFADDPAPEITSPAPVEERMSSVFESSWLHGDELDEAEWSDLYGEGVHVERNKDGERLSFFTEDGRHVVARRKEARVERPHAHILRSGNSLWLDDGLLGMTVGMAGAFNAQVFLGNTNLARFLSVIRNPLNVARTSGQRIFVQVEGEWRQLGVPSAFEMGLKHVRWLYGIGGDLLEVTTTAAEDAPRIDLRVRVVHGEPRAFLLSHLLVMGDGELSQPVLMKVDAASGKVECRPDPNTLLGEKWPDLRFSIEANPEILAAIGGDELLFADGETRNGPFAVLQTVETAAFELSLKGENPAAASSESASSPSLPRLRHEGEEAARRVSDLLPWFAHDAWIHFTAPHGLEQYGGAAWGVRDVCQGPVEWLLAAREYATVRRILLKVFEQQYEADGGWPQWFMFDPFRFIQSVHSHGDIVFWPIKALCDYVEESNDLGILEESVSYTDPQTFTSTPHRATVAEHAAKVLAQYEARRIRGTALVNYGDGDWDDTLQPADPRLKSQMVSAWTVGLAYDAFRRYRTVCERSGRNEDAARLGELLGHIREDFRKLLMPEGVTAGFAIFEEGGMRPLIHPTDEATGIRYRLLPMTRSVLAELFTPEEARRHFEIIRDHLLCPDGVRLMSDPIPYAGGVERRFKRAETAANFGREIGLMYTHAHLRYAEALAKLGNGEELWAALQAVNPIGIREAVPNAQPRQANVYFTSSDGAFPDRYQAGKRFGELREGTVPVKGGWRLYSSGPGLYIHKVVTCLLGLRESYGDVVLDPVLPKALDGLTVETEWGGHALEIRYRVRERGFAPSRITLNGEELPTDRRDENPYREGGVRLSRDVFEAGLREGVNRLEVCV